MLFGKDKKPGLAILLGKKSEDSENEEDRDDEMVEDFGKELLEALKEEDAKKVGMLVSDFIRTCK